MTTEPDYARIAYLAAQAHPTDDADWGTARQTNAMNALLDDLAAYGWDWEQDEYLPTYCLKATSEEIIEATLDTFVEWASPPVTIGEQYRRAAADWANDSTRADISADSSLSHLCGWLQWCDSNGCHWPHLSIPEVEGAYTLDTAWEQIIDMHSQDGGA